MSRIHTDVKHTVTQGTITHMPPELIRHGQLHVSADVWAFGVLLCEMFCGHRAWLGMSYTQVMQAVAYEQRGPEWPPEAPHQLMARLFQLFIECVSVVLANVLSLAPVDGFSKTSMPSLYSRQELSWRELWLENWLLACNSKMTCQAARDSRKHT